MAFGEDGQQNGEDLAGRGHGRRHQRIEGGDGEEDEALAGGAAHRELADGHEDLRIGQAEAKAWQGLLQSYGKAQCRDAHVKIRVELHLEVPLLQPNRLHFGLELALLPSDDTVTHKGPNEEKDAPQGRWGAGLGLLCQAHKHCPQDDQENVHILTQGVLGIAQEQRPNHDRNHFGGLCEGGHWERDPGDHGSGGAILRGHLHSP
mmetsp:Transcript_47724/g.78582  ORF Transcript_47724/g.78582 Transcript_47724/m.78582 type:complete len:205 (+) Transcript_47724:617-1231(+)